MTGEASRTDILLRCERLVVGHRGQALLPPMDLAIRRGRLLLVAGRNGAGKSTWLKTLLGLIPPVSGHIQPAEPRPRMAYVPQSDGLDRILPVRAGTVVSWGRMRGWSFLWPLASRADRAASQRAQVQADAADLVAHPFRDLSGGQRQRVLLARLLASEADIVLLDEPTASMDMAAQAQTYERLAELAHTRGMAVIVVTHVLSDAAVRADEALFFHRDESDQDRGEGLVVNGPPETVFAHRQFIRLFGRITPSAGQADASPAEQ